MIYTKFSIDRPDDMSATMEIEMTVGEWRKLHGQLVDTEAYPAGKLSRSIRDVLSQAEKVFAARADDR